MELLPSVKLQNGRISLLSHLIFPTRSLGKSGYKGELGPVSLNSFQLQKREKLVLRCSYDEGGSIAQQDFESMPLSLELEPICDESEFDRVVDEAQPQRLEDPVVILWSASWCRKCIYLKPKLEKLAADYNPRIRFYSVDVNKVPHKLVVRAGVTKMPTIQLWRNGKKEAEVIGGQKAHLVVNEVRDMIENGDSV